jgi:hypothetical protein
VSVARSAIVHLGLGMLAAVCGARPAAAETRDSAALLDRAYRHLAQRDLQAARLAFAAAADAGAPAQQVALELGYLALADRNLAQARHHFTEASHGPDPTLARRGNAEAGGLPRHLWADLYAESFGWSRSRASVPSDDLVTMARARAFLRPALTLDLQVYAFAQATRDVASRGRGPSGVPEIYADNFALLGAGVLFRFWNGRAATFAQLGPAIDLLETSQNRVTFDVRAGGMLALSSMGCGGGASTGARSRWRLIPCAESYVEATYVSRFNHNAVAVGRVRAGATYLVTGPVAWQLLAEGRAATDRNHDYYNNFADAGLVQRWRLGGRVPLDVNVGTHAGSYFGVAGRDPAPDHLGYVDLRLVASTYLGF